MRSSILSQPKLKHNYVKEIVCDPPFTLRLEQIIVLNKIALIINLFPNKNHYRICVKWDTNNNSRKQENKTMNKSFYFSNVIVKQLELETLRNLEDRFNSFL